MAGIPVWVIVAVAVVAALVFFYWLYSEQDRKKRCNRIYAEAVSMMKGGDYAGAEREFKRLNGYKDSAELAEQCRKAVPRQRYEKGVALMNQGDYMAALNYFDETGPEAASARMMIEKCRERLHEKEYDQAVRWMESGDYESARQSFNLLKGFRDSEAKGFECAKKLFQAKQAAAEADREADYARAVRLFEQGYYRDARRAFTSLPDGYKDRESYTARIHAAEYETGVKCFEEGRMEQARNHLEDIPRDYKDVETYLRRACARLYGLDFCGASPFYQHDWEQLTHFVDLDSEVRKMGHGRRRCRCCGKEEDYSYNYDTDGY